MPIKRKLIPVLTEAGKQAVFKADIARMEVKITHIAIGSGRYEPTSDLTALKEEKLRVDILSSSIDKSNYQMRLNTIFKDEDLEFYINEFGVFLEDGTLFAVWSSPTKTLAYKSIWSKPIFAFTLKIVDVNLDAITIIDRGLDLKLNYLSEILNISNAISNLNFTVMALFEKIKKSKILNYVSFLNISNSVSNLNSALIHLLFRVEKDKKEVDALFLTIAIIATQNNLQRVKERFKIKKLEKRLLEFTTENSISITQIHKREVNR